MSTAKYSEDWRSLQKYANMFPTHFHLAYAVAEGLYADGNHAQALKYYKKAIAINAEAVIDYGHVGYAFEMGELDYKKGVHYFQKALSKVTAHDKWLTQRLAWCYIQSKEYVKALDVLTEHCKHEPTDAWAQGKIGYCHQMFGDYKTALEYHMIADGIGSTENAWNTGNIGYCYQMTGDYARGLKYHLKAEAMDGNDIWNLKNVGYCYQKTGSYTESLRYHQRVYEEDPTDIWNVKNVGYSYQQLGNYEKAVKYHLLVEKMVPDDTWNLGHLGYCYQRINKHKEALPYYKKVYQLAPEDVWNKYQLGYCYFTQYNLEEAEYYLRDGDDDKYALLHWGSVYFVQGQTYRALELYKQSLQMFDSFVSFMSVFTSDRVYLEADYGLSATQCSDMAWEIETYDGFRNTW